jgi:hypothetical protein
MSNSLQNTRTGLLIVYSVLVCAALLLFLIVSPGRAAAVGPQGTLTLTMPQGKSGKALKRQGVRISRLGRTTKSKFKGSFQFRNTVRNVSLDGEPKVTFRGGLVFKKKFRGKVKRQVRSRVRQVKLTSLAYEFFGGRGIIRATHKGKRVSLFEPRGTRSVNSQAAFEDPYADLCDLAATSKTPGDIPPPAPLPELDPSEQTTGEPITWGFKDSYRGYIFGIQGVFQGEEGATVNQPQFPGPPPTGFTFPFGSGVFSQVGDNYETIISGSGKVTTCHKGQFRLTMSDPTVYVNSKGSRIIMTIDTNVSGDWIPSQRVDFATLNTVGIVPTEDGGVFTWSAVPAELTAAGAASLRLCGPDAPQPCPYAADKPLDPITVRARVPTG